MYISQIVLGYVLSKRMELGYCVYIGITNIVKADDATAITIGALKTTSPINNNIIKIGIQIPI